MSKVEEGNSPSADEVESFDDDAGFVTNEDDMMVEDQDVRKIQIGGDISANAKFPSNYISTTKYTFYNFLPKQLYEQFRRLCNFYFLLVVCIQFIPNLSPLNPFASIFPLAFVLVVSGTKEAVEDRRRAKQDKEVNARPALVLRDGVFVSETWKSLRTGDIVKVNGKDFFPADLLLLSSSEPHGLAYVETANLDGETNLKIRQAPKETVELAKSEEELANLRAVITSELPNDRLYNFDGSITLDTDGKRETIALSPKQMLLRGARLKNTQWAHAIIVFSGVDTKLMQNAVDPPSKQSQIDKEMNWDVLVIFLFQLFACLIAAGGNVRFTSTTLRTMTYMGSVAETDAWFSGFTTFFTFVILLNIMIPISLYVSAEIVRVVQARLMEWDEEMYHAGTNSHANARTSNLNEELGQVEYVFSDKTGTLTCNTMEFLKCSIAGEKYGHTITEAAIGAALREGRVITAPEHTERFSLDGGQFYFDDHTIIDNLKSEHKTAPMIDMFLTLLAVCHTVIPEQKEGEELVYQAASPDEGALVAAARGLGYFFHTRTPTHVVIRVDDSDRTFEICEVLEFNSTRKRMSVIAVVGEGRERKRYLFTKGADSVIYERLAAGQQEIKDITLEHLEYFAADGLRTLCLAYAVLDEGEYQQWQREHKAAEVAIIDRDEKLMAVAEKIEKNLTLIGASAIEDKLQEGVPDTIKLLLDTGIKVWVLTGDKQETAINIGFSSALLHDDMHLIIVESEDEDEVHGQLLMNLEKWRGSDMPLGLIIEGKSLLHALKENMRHVLLELGCICKSVICCRVSPMQKALVVKLVKDNLKCVTLAIGDGANDVSMIQAAHLGIGIVGNEGRQAAMSSDYSIGQFRFLARLLLVHGRWNYRRMSSLILYSFYKNMCFALCQFWFAFFSGFSGQTLFDSHFVSVFNVFFAGLPIMVLASLDQDLNAKFSLKFPTLYRAGMMKEDFNFKLFLTWLGAAAFHSVVIFFGVKLMMPQHSGRSVGLWWMGTTMYTCVVLIVNLKVFMEMTYVTVLHVVGMVLSVGSWFLMVVVASFLPTQKPTLYFLCERLFGSSEFWLTIIIIPVTALLPDFIFKFVHWRYYPRFWYLIAELQKYNLSTEDAHKMANNLTPQTASLAKLSRVKSVSSHSPTTGFADDEYVLMNDPIDAAMEKNAAMHRQRTGYAFAQESGQSFAMALMPVKHAQKWRKIAKRQRSEDSVRSRRTDDGMVSTRSVKVAESEHTVSDLSLPGCTVKPKDAG